MEVLFVVKVVNLGMLSELIVYLVIQTVLLKIHTQCQVMMFDSVWY